MKRKRHSATATGGAERESAGGPGAAHAPHQDAKQRIWQVVASIPRGRVFPYGEVARQAGLAGAARLVGRALRQLPAGSKLPWHRVVNAGGYISLPPGSPGRAEQMRRLREEGVRVGESGRIPLLQHRWRPGDDGNF